jgi:hypothetical protein
LATSQSPIALKALKFQNQRNKKYVKLVVTKPGGIIKLRATVRNSEKM